MSTKGHELYSLGGVNDWILHDSKYNSIAATIISILEFISQVFIALLALAGLVKFLSIKDKRDIFQLFCVIFIFTCSFFVLFSEVRNRYSLIFVNSLIIFASLGLDRLLSRNERILSSLKPVIIYFILTSCVILVTFFGYRQLIAKNYSFEQLQPVTWKKEIGKVNLSAFQIKLFGNGNKLEIENSKAKWLHDILPKSG